MVWSNGTQFAAMLSQMIVVPVNRLPFLFRDPAAACTECGRYVEHVDAALCCGLAVQVPAICVAMFAGISGMGRMVHTERDAAISHWVSRFQALDGFVVWLNISSWLSGVFAATGISIVVPEAMLDAQ